jgi:isopentenyl diphosphate isomerase/L-lactate dehydrogenase-like FMN-dependent dehydrogenase
VTNPSSSSGGTSLPLPYHSVDDLERLARARLDAGTWSYLSDVAEDGRTHAREKAVLDEIVLRQRGLGEGGTVDTSTVLFGQPLRLPVLAAPTSGQAFVHADAERAMVRGCAQGGTLAVVPMTGSTLIEDIGSQGAPWWLQLYLPSDAGMATAIAARAAAAGAGAIVVSIDVPVLARRHNIPAGYPPGWNERLLTLRQGSPESLFILDNAPFTWNALAALRARATVPLLVKGVLDPDDVRLAIEHGADGVVLSTHGGRQLDCAPTAAEVLPAVVEAAAGRCRVLADGGVRRGSHVLRLMVRGADAVLVGRPALWGLAVDGENGVRDIFRLLERELVTAMGLTGCWSTGAIGPDVEWHPPAPRAAIRNIPG